VNKDSDPEPTSFERKSLLESGIPGDRLNLTGRLLTISGKPVSGALLDFWQVDGNGVYGNIGYKLRGHQYTDTQGRYQLETVIPGYLAGPYQACPRQSTGSLRSGADHPALRPQRGWQPERPSFQYEASGILEQERWCQQSYLQLRPGYESVIWLKLPRGLL
jgi:hypothetical protein